MKKIIATLLFCFTAGASTAAFGSVDWLQLDVSLGIDRTSGHTLYRIGGTFRTPSGSIGELHFPISELKFPVNVFWAAVDVTAVIREKYLVRINMKSNSLGGLVDFNNRSGTMEDSDWGIWYLEGNLWARSNSLDVFSESDAELNGFIADAAADYVLYSTSRFSIHLGAGFLYQHFDFSISNLDQWYPSYQEYSAYLSPEYGIHYYVDGKVLTYEVKFFAPYAEAGGIYRISETLNITTRMAYSPIVFAEDVDDHILRSKLSRGNSNGWMFSGTVDARYRFNRHWFAGAGILYRYISTRGTQNQEFYKDTIEGPKGPIGTIDNQLESSQFGIGIYSGYSL